MIRDSPSLVQGARKIETENDEKTMETTTKELKTKHMFLNMGPAHPAMHGIIKIVLELDGETVINADIDIGYLHRCFEKHCENGNYMQAIPYTDRLNYVSPLINNVGYVMAVEKLFGIEVPKRCQYIRVIMSEISRITDHLTCIGATAMELGAMTVFLYMMKAREYLYDLIEDVSGARITTSYTRIGGVKTDLPDDFKEKCREALKELRSVLEEVHRLLTKNRIFVDRMRGVGKISQEFAQSYGITGPFLRSTGIGYDVRKANPYLIYDSVEFKIPTGIEGDNLDRYLVRMEEMEQSSRIIEQALRDIPEGSVRVDLLDRIIESSEMIDLAKMGKTKELILTHSKVAPTLEGSEVQSHFRINVDKRTIVIPSKQDTYSNIEGLMNHFMLIMYKDGIRAPEGEVYFPVEGANGELGFYIVSNGDDRPHRVRVRPPCFPIMAAFHEIIQGDMVADIIPTFGSVNMIGGELDR